MSSALSKINSRAPLDRSPKKNWVDRAGGLPMYIRRIANHLHQEKGMTISHAIATAVNAVKKMCSSGDVNWPGKQQVNAGSQAEACAAVASWERKKAGARVSKGDFGRKWTDAEFIEFLTGEDVTQEIHKGCGCEHDKGPGRREKKKKELEKAFKSNNSMHVPNGMDIDYMPPNEKSRKRRRKKTKMGFQRVDKANPRWEGDGFQPPGQPRGKGGKFKEGGVREIPFKKNDRVVLTGLTGGNAKYNGKKGTVQQNRAGGSNAVVILDSRERVSVRQVNLQTDVDKPKASTPEDNYRKLSEAQLQGLLIRRSLPEKNRKLIEAELKNREIGKLLEELSKAINSEFSFFNADLNADETEFLLTGEIEKREDEKQLVFGWCSIAKKKDGTIVVDKQGDVLEDIDQMEKVAYDFVLHSRDGGEMHIRKGVSTLVESFVSTPEKWEALGIPEGTLPVGWWVGFHVKDKGVWEKVKKKELTMFSVHGSGMRKAYDGAE